MGGGSGGGASANNEITFNDTSEYMYRDSSTKRGGFEGSFGFVTNNTDLDTVGTENVNQTGSALPEADRDELRRQIEVLNNCVLDQFCPDKDDLKTRADLAWDRARSLFDDTRGLIDDEVDDLKADTLNYINMWHTQWARMAGSSLNCAVNELRNRAVTELNRRIAGIIAERLTRLKEHETQALAEAFKNNLDARMEPNKLAFMQIGALYGVLRGAETTQVTDRDYDESKDESSRQFTLMGKVFHDITDVSDNSGTYAGELDDAVAASKAIQDLVPSA